MNIALQNFTQVEYKYAAFILLTVVDVGDGAVQSHLSRTTVQDFVSMNMISLFFSSYRQPELRLISRTQRFSSRGDLDVKD